MIHTRPTLRCLVTTGKLKLISEFQLEEALPPLLPLFTLIITLSVSFSLPLPPSLPLSLFFSLSITPSLSPSLFFVLSSLNHMIAPARSPPPPHTHNLTDTNIVNYPSLQPGGRLA